MQPDGNHHLELTRKFSTLHIACAAGILLTVIGGFWIRLYNLTLFGIGGSDPILYFTLAEHWLRGEHVYQVGSSTTVFRPLYLAFNAMALWLFGHADYSLKVANALVDGTSVILVATLAWLVIGRPLAALLISITYASLPVALLASRMELPHVLSTLLIIGGALCLFGLFANIENRKRYIYSVAAGLFFALASLTHEELIFITVGSALFMFFHAQFQVKMGLRSTFFLLASHLVFPIIAVTIIVYNEWFMVVQQSSLGRGFSAESTDGLRVPRFIWEASSALFSPVFAILYCLALAIHFFGAVKERGSTEGPKNILLAFCLWSPIIYIAVYSIFFPTLYVRGLLPFAPLMAIGVLGTYARKLPKGISGQIGIAVAAGVLCVSSLAAFSFEKIAGSKGGREWSRVQWPVRSNIIVGINNISLHSNFMPNTYRNYWNHIDNAFHDLVNRENRVLIVPSVVLHAPGRRALQTRTYLGDNAIYRIDHTNKSLPELIRKKKIRYIVWAQGQLKGEPGSVARYRYNGNWNPPRAINLAEELGMPEYTMEAESLQVTEALIQFKANEVLLFSKDTYQGYYTRVWRLNH